MTIKHRLVVMNFLQLFVWGSWLISLGGYMHATLKFTGGQIGSIYATMGIASLFMPAVLGVVADRWVNAERVLGACHLVGAASLLMASRVSDFGSMYFLMLLNAMAYMPSIALNNAVSYMVLEKHGSNIITDFPPIRMWGTIGFIAAMWTVDLLGWTISHLQFYVGAAAAVLLGLYAFTMPACPPARASRGGSLVSKLGLDALVLFKQRKMLAFFLFAMMLGAAPQIGASFGQPFLYDFSTLYPDSFAGNHPGLLMSISQISETLFILTIPFFLLRFGIKKVMLMSAFAWALRFAFFGIGNPGGGLIFLVLSMIVYGMAFDFFIISGSLFVKNEAPGNMVASAQGLFMLMSNGAGAFLGGMVSGVVVDYFTADGVKDWPGIWFAFASYALVLGLALAFVFDYKHDANKLKAIAH
ncbi:MAG: MFS transporter [Xanthomonadales bacterium]|nr:MFS transporter [Xanthomonadales bacterium]